MSGKRSFSEAYDAAHAEEIAQARATRTVPVTAANGAWLVVITKGGKERSVHDRLVAQGFEVFLPLEPLIAPAAKRRGVSSVPFFSRLVFARATLDAHRWQAIFSTIGVARVMCDPMKPKGVKPELIERLRAQMFDRFLAIGLVDPARPPPPRPEKDRRKWVTLADVVAGLTAETVADRRESLLLSLLNEGHTAVTQTIRRT